MRFDLITIFPEFFAGPLGHGIVRRAREAGLIEVRVQDLREFTKDRHRTVDDRPFGGGEGMVMKPEPLFEAVESLLGKGTGEATAAAARESNTAIVLLSAAGKRFTQETARSYAALNRIIFICGRYEGVDERVTEHLATEEISVGDFVLSGGAANSYRRRDLARLSALHTACRVSRVERAGSVDRRKSCGSGEMAAQGCTGKDAPKPAGFALARMN